MKNSCKIACITSLSISTLAIINEEGYGSSNMTLRYVSLNNN